MHTMGTAVPARSGRAYQAGHPFGVNTFIPVSVDPIRLAIDLSGRVDMCFF